MNIVVNEREDAIIDIIRRFPEITRGEIATELGISIGTVGTVISGLKSRGVLIREGSKKTGKWRIVG